MVESPRFLVVKGDEQGAKAVLKSMYAMNGHPFDNDVSLSMQAAQNSSEESKSQLSIIRHRLNLVFASRLRVLITFVFAFFSMLAVSAVLIDAWGPIAYARLLDQENS